MTSINIKNLTKEYPGRRVLDELNFSIQKGSIHGFLGPNGAGKTTTMKIMAGLINATSGQVELPENFRVGILSEQPPLYEHMKVKAYLKFVKDIFTLDQDQAFSVDEVLKRVGLSQMGDRLIKNLSKGYKQKVGIAQALIHNPEILILDEPMVGLDPNAIEEIRGLIKELAKDHTIILSSHQLHEVSLLCDEITIISEGKILKSGSLKELEGELSRGQILEIEAQRLDKKLKDKLKSMFPVEVCHESNDEKEQVSFELHFKGDGDYRKDIGRVFLEHDSVILGLKEKSVNLEDLFKETVAKGDQR